MVSLDSLKKIGITNYQIDKWVSACYIYVENGQVDIIDADVYETIMESVLMHHPEMFDEFINQCYNPSLIQYYQFLKLILDGELEKSLPLMYTLIKDKAFLEEYEKILLFVSIIEEYKLSDLYIPEEENELIKAQIAIFKKYLLSFNYPMAKEFLKEIRKVHDCLEYRVIDKILESKKDTIKYILRDGMYPSDVTNDNLKRMEREVLCYLELRKFDLFLQRVNELGFIYQNEEHNMFQIIIILVNMINSMQYNRRHVSSRSFSIFHGDFNSVLYALLISKDYYRAHDLIEEEIKDANQFDIYLAILFILIHSVMYLNNYNLEFIESQMKLDSSSSIENILPKRVSLSKIDGNLIKDYENRKRNKKWENKSFYQMYLDAYRSGEYDVAREYLKGFSSKLEAMTIDVNLDYLFKELDYLSEKSKEVDEDNRKKALEYQNKAWKQLEEKQYNDAIDTITKWCQCLNYVHPRAKALLAKCYYKLGNYEKALKLYNEVLEYYIYPVDYEDIIMALYALKRYDEMDVYFEAREEYDWSSLKVYYVMSLASMQQGKYDKAIEMLKKAQDIGVEVYGVIPDFSREIKILSMMSQGKEVKTFTLDDYIEYGVTDEDTGVLENIKQFRDKYKDDYLSLLLLDISNKNVDKKFKIEYLLTVVRILKGEHAKVNYGPVYEYIDLLLSAKELTEEDVRRFTLTMKNYQNL